MLNRKIASELVKLAKELLAAEPEFKMSDKLAKVVADKVAKVFKTSVSSVKHDMLRDTGRIKIKTKDGDFSVQIDVKNKVIVSVGKDGMYEDVSGKHLSDIQDLVTKASRKLLRALK